MAAPSRLSFQQHTAETATYSQGYDEPARPQITVLGVVSQQRKPARGWQGWAAAGTAGGLVQVTAVYFHLCAFGIAVEWAYLTGMLRNFPLTVIIAVGWNHWPGGAARD